RPDFHGVETRGIPQGVKGESARAEIETMPERPTRLGQAGTEAREEQEPGRCALEVATNEQALAVGVRFTSRMTRARVVKQEPRPLPCAVVPLQGVRIDLGSPPNQACGIPDDRGAVWDVLGHDRPCPDDGLRSDGQPRENYGARADGRPSLHERA